jgi:hypothetical protein
MPLANFAGDMVPNTTQQSTYGQQHLPPHMAQHISFPFKPSPQYNQIDQIVQINQSHITQRQNMTVDNITNTDEETIQSTSNSWQKIPSNKWKRLLKAPTLQLEPLLLQSNKYHHLPTEYGGIRSASNK